ncbi:MAG: hypothetical protein HOC63_14785 [Rhodospirillales bacterium]|jgi:hypothetical protein|nr:hypothetical protein [Rhodospirillales bacterium]MBT4041730.1 hypothetical protein [Rhodospirillales bacterium]MBT4627943.1 hypothetical protein [Rhodospirillales bacterium]MBT5352193.1 hypothetical protein [Rhodospirillales bacterium]MBT5521485.1 hypothetical protein [Rhodospirillales bacterium]
MLTIILSFIKSLWWSWASLFHGIPHGDPYVAFVVLFIAFCVATWVVQKICNHESSQRSQRFDNSFYNDEDRFKTYCKVMNIR